MKIVCESLNEFKKIDKPTYGDLGIGIYKGVKPEHRDAGKWLLDNVLMKIKHDETSDTKFNRWYFVDGKPKYFIKLDLSPIHMFLGYDGRIFDKLEELYKLTESDVDALIKTMCYELFGWEGLNPFLRR